MYILCCKQEYLFYFKTCKTGDELPSDALKLAGIDNQYHAVGFTVWGGGGGANIGIPGYTKMDANFRMLRCEYCQGGDRGWSNDFDVLCAVELKEVSDITKTLKDLVKQKMNEHVQVRINWLSTLAQFKTDTSMAAFINFTSWLSVLLDCQNKYKELSGKDKIAADKNKVEETTHAGFAIAFIMLAIYIRRWFVIDGIAFQVQRYGSVEDTPCLITELKSYIFIDFIALILIPVIITWLFFNQDLATYVSFILMIIGSIVQIYLNYQESDELGEKLEDLAKLPSPFKSDASKIKAIQDGVPGQK